MTMPDSITSEEWQPHPERAADLEAYYREGLSFQAARARYINGRSRLGQLSSPHRRHASPVSPLPSAGWYPPSG